MSETSHRAPELPHRAPFRLLDRLLEVTPERGVALKLVAASDPCVTPGGVLPAAFVLETLAQAGGAYLNALGGSSSHAGLLAQVEAFSVVESIRVGDEMRIEVSLVRRFRTTTVLQGRVLVDGQVRSEGRFVLSLG